MRSGTSPGPVTLYTPRSRFSSASAIASARSSSCMNWSIGLKPIITTTRDWRR